MTTQLHAVPKPQPRTDADRRASRIASAQKLARSRRAPIAKNSTPKNGGSGKPKARKPLKARNAKRSKLNHARSYGGEYADWIRSLPCEGCGYQGPAVEAAHTTTGGMGRKADCSTLVPLCGERAIHNYGTGIGFVEGCHRVYHQQGQRTMQAVYGVDLRARAAELWAAWQQMRGGDE